MRQRPVSLDQYGISRWEYQELYAFCRQYPIKKAKARDLLGVSSPDLSGMPRGNSVGHPTESVAMRRLRYLQDVDLIDEAARETAGGVWYAALIYNCCLGRSYTTIPPEQLPTSNRNQYFAARREFFWRLHQLRHAAKDDTPGDVDG
ncbi:MAG: hypothetical protein IJ246_05265 [Clostridia bacterium]|nr:hypothetical protein [Clostridia bacterium]